MSPDTAATAAVLKIHFTEYGLDYYPFVSSITSYQNYSHDYCVTNTACIYGFDLTTWDNECMTWDDAVWEVEELACQGSHEMAEVEVTWAGWGLFGDIELSNSTTVASLMGASKIYLIITPPLDPDFHTNGLVTTITYSYAAGVELNYEVDYIYPIPSTGVPQSSSSLARGNGIPIPIALWPAPQKLYQVLS